MRKWERDKKVITCDLLIITKGIQNLSKKLANETCMLHKNDAQSVHIYVQKNPIMMFHYMETILANPHQIQGQWNGKNILFTFGIQSL